MRFHPNLSYRFRAVLDPRSFLISICQFFFNDGKFLRKNCSTIFICRWMVSIIYDSKKCS